MNLEQLLSEPQLVEIKLTKPEIVEKHGEELCSTSMTDKTWTHICSCQS